MSIDNIILIGMPGSGKSTIGVLLAKALCMDFIDTDLIIQKQAGKTLQSIIEEDGLAKFLSIENDVLKNLICSNSIIASGGSAVLAQDGIEHLRQIGTVVYLEISYQTMVDRISNAQSRGLVLQSNEQLSDLFELRMPLYEKYADLKINCDGLSAQNCLSCVLAALNQAGCAEQFFASIPGTLELYQQIEITILKLIPAAIEFQKSQISFGCKRKFAWIWLPVRKIKNRPDLYFVLSLSLGRRLNSPRIVEALEPYPGRWMHHILISQSVEIDQELIGWIEEAIAFANR